MSRLVIGIDTGGTYTDAALIDTEAGKVLTTAKAITTKGNLAIGVADALNGVFNAYPAVTGAQIALVCLSTTLATNAIVEGHGSSIGVILIGFDAKMQERTGITKAFPDTKILMASGGHTYGGSAKNPLDEAAIIDFVAQMPHVEAFCIAAEYSVRNPAHEHRARELIEGLTGKPVTISSDLAHALDAPRRALTAALNARIISRIVALISAVHSALQARGIDAPLKVVKGDGTLSSVAKIVRRPIETVLSGPAASVIGSKFLTGLSDFVVSDIGGTTTDVAVLENGWPRLRAEGALVGGHRTLVRAVDMRTFALGGDSEVEIDDASGKVVLLPNRIVPLSLLGARYPQIIKSLQVMLADYENVPYASRFALLPFGLTTPRNDVSSDDIALYNRIGAEPIALHQLIQSPRDLRSLQRLVKLGFVQLAGFTPSDAGHVLDAQNQWSREAAYFGALTFSRWRRMASPKAGESEARAFATEVFDAVVQSSGRAIIETLTGAAVSKSDPFINAVLGGSHLHKGLRVNIAPQAPIVAVGGPAPVFYPELGNRMQAKLVLPDFGDVANAVGAAAGVIKVQAIVEITSTGVGHYRIHHSGAPVESFDATAALAKAATLAMDEARAQAADLGARAVEISTRIERIDLPDTAGDKGLIAATIFAECWGAAA